MLFFIVARVYKLFEEGLIMGLIKQLVTGTLSKAEVAKRTKKIQAVINANPARKSAVDQLVGAARPTSKKALESARIKAIVQVMRTNLKFAKAIDNAAKS